ncbi:MAG: RNA-binding cell elongation regulator Jag/EloR [Bacillota bacterium]
MKKEVEKTAKTVEEAIDEALKELGVPRDKVKIEVVEEPSKGLFGFIGTRMAKIKVSYEEDAIAIANTFLHNVLDNLHVEAQMEARKNDDYLNLTLTGEDLGILIGRRGETLDALQYLTNLAVNKELEKRIKIILDIEGYRERREQTLVKLAQRLSEKVKRTGTDVVLEPMNPHERRVIHTALQQDQRVYTFSEGEDPYRKVVISLKK